MWIVLLIWFGCVDFGIYFIVLCVIECWMIDVFLCVEMIMIGNDGYWVWMCINVEKFEVFGKFKFNSIKLGLGFFLRCL